MAIFTGLFPDMSREVSRCRTNTSTGRSRTRRLEQGLSTHHCSLTSVFRLVSCIILHSKRLKSNHENHSRLNLNLFVTKISVGKHHTSLGWFDSFLQRTVFNRPAGSWSPHGNKVVGSIINFNQIMESTTLASHHAFPAGWHSNTQGRLHISPSATLMNNP